MKYHPVVYQIKDLLTGHQLSFEVFEHEPVRTSEEAAKIRHGYSLSQGAKAMIVKVKYKAGGKGYVMLVIPGDKRFDNLKVKETLALKEFRFATTEKVAELTQGIESGGVPPFGTLFQLPVFVDATLLQNERIIFNAGDRRYSIGMRSDDYLRVVKPRVALLI